MNEKIVVPLDGSSIGESALPYIKDLISKISPNIEVEIILLQVLSHISIRATYGSVGVIHQTESLEEQIEVHKKATLEYLTETGEGLKDQGVLITAKVVVGNVAEEIVKVAEESNANLIAMSTHGRSGIRRWALGSVADKVLRMGSRIPIVMIKASKSG